MEGGIFFTAEILNKIAQIPGRGHTFTPMKNILFASLTVIALLAASGCKEKTPAEKAADAIDKSYDKTKDAVKDGAKKTGDAIEKAGEKVKDAVK